MKRPEQYRTKQREALLQYIASLGGGHATAAQIAAYFKNGRVPVGRTTVYRHLEQLTQNGRLRKYTVDGETGACYQYLENPVDCQIHFHLKCERCGVLLHLACDTWNNAQRHIFEEHTFRVNSTKTVLYGICEHCM